MLIKRYEAKVDSAEKNGKVEYEIKVSQLISNQNDNNIEPISQRYSQLREFHEKLAHQVKTLKLKIELPSFPKRAFFGKTNQKKERIEQRKEHLKAYFNELLNIDKLQSFPCVKLYLPNEEKTTVKNLKVTIEEQLKPNLTRRVTQQIQGTSPQDNEFKKKSVTQQIQSPQNDNYLKNNSSPQQDQSEKQNFEPNIFKIFFQDDRECWEYKMSFEELKGIHEALKEQGLKVPKLPNDKYFKLTIENENAQQADKRKFRLQGYFNVLFGKMTQDELDKINKERKEDEKMKNFDYQSKNYFNQPQKDHISEAQRKQQYDEILSSDIIRYLIDESKKYSRKAQKLQEMKRSLCQKPDQS